MAILFRFRNCSRHFTTDKKSLLSCYRSHTCGDLRAQDAGKNVKLSGWVHALRRFGPLMFLSLRDKYGTTQFVFNNETEINLFQQAETLRSEYVVSITGKVLARPDNMKNPNMDTGEIEVAAEQIEILNASDTPPIKANLGDQPSEKVRLRYRYIDLRRQYLQRNLLIRSNVTLTVRQHLCRNGFVEVETPTLFKSTPEGAREFLVPTRTKDSFFALTQSPQQYKQLLMVGGVDRYFQIARCYRDESGRADRQPEFTQIDLELSFTDMNQITSIIEGLVKDVWDCAAKTSDQLPMVKDESFSGEFPNLGPLSPPFPRMTYREAMESYGSDKPDIRYDMKLVQITDLLRETTHLPFQSLLSKNCNIYAFNAKGLAKNGFSRKDMDNLRAESQLQSVDGSPAIIVHVKDEQWRSSITNKLSSQEIEAISSRLQVEDGDVLLLGSGKGYAPCTLLGRMRQHCAQLLHKQGDLQKELDRSNFKFLWIVDFPLFVDDGENGFSSCHHPFTAPHDDDLHDVLQYKNGDSLEKLLKLRGQNFDLVCNGWELGGGSMRIHSPKLQAKVLKDILQLPELQLKNFSHLLEGLSYGCPPHGGIALGLDRLIAILCGASSLRDVIAFPKSASGHELMTDSPGPVLPQQLAEYHIKLAS